jgi:hypothetical protein
MLWELYCVDGILRSAAPHDAVIWTGTTWTGVTDLHAETGKARISMLASMG